MDIAQPFMRDAEKSKDWPKGRGPGLEWRAICEQSGAGPPVVVFQAVLFVCIELASKVDMSAFIMLEGIGSSDQHCGFHVFISVCFWSRF